MPEFMDMWQLAKLLGMSRNYVYILTRRGMIPAYKFGKKWMFNKKEIQRWIETKAFLPD